MDKKSLLREAAKLAEEGELDRAWDLTELVLLEEPNDVSAITMATQINRKARRMVTAYTWAKAGIANAPELAAAWLNMGCAAADLFRRDEAEMAYEQCEKLLNAKGWTASQRALLLINKSAMYLDYAEWALAERLASDAVRIEPENKKACGNLGIAKLAQRKWSEGWRYYGAISGMAQRPEYIYGDAPIWDGRHTGTVIFQGEQGLGDEIAFASMLPDAFLRVEQPIIDCDARLQGLFTRSFPKAKVYGTRWAKELEWKAEDTKPDASIQFGQLGQFFRRRDRDFPRQSYLMPDPERTHMWRSLRNIEGGPAIGIAWTGGVSWTGAKFRRLTLEQLLPIFQSVPGAKWVSLQYQDACEEIEKFHVEHPEIDLRQYPYATLTKDYDDTAALVASLDCVIGPPTSVIHLAGALDVPTLAMAAPYDCWKFASELFLPSSVTKIPNDGQWNRTIDHAATLLRERFGTSIHWLRSTPAAGLQRATALDSIEQQPACADHAIDAVPVANLAQRSY